MKTADNIITIYTTYIPSQGVDMTTGEKIHTIVLRICAKATIHCAYAWCEGSVWFRTRSATAPLVPSTHDTDHTPTQRAE